MMLCFVLSLTQCSLQQWLQEKSQVFFLGTFFFFGAVKDIFRDLH